MATARDVVEAALREIGVLAASETATAEDASIALARLNRFIDRLATERLTIYTITRTVFALDHSGDGTYTVGPTAADVAIARPVHVADVRFVDISTTPSTEYPLNDLTEEGYQSITLKDLTSNFPQAYYWNPTFPNATLVFWPIPTSTTLNGVIYAWTAVAQLATLDTAVALPPGYEEMLVTNLALLLCPTFERQPNPALVKSASESLAAIKRANLRLQDMSFEPAALVGRGMTMYDIRRG